MLAFKGQLHEEMLLCTNYLTSVHSRHKIAVTIISSKMHPAKNDCMNFKQSFDISGDPRGLPKILLSISTRKRKISSYSRLPTAVLIYPGLFLTLVGFV